MTSGRFAAVLAFLAMAGAPLRAQADSAEESRLVAELQAGRDDADVELLAKLALRKTPSAATTLVAFYGQVSSVWMKREVLRALGRFEGAGDAAATALDHVATVAANVPEIELRDAAFEALEGCATAAPPYLAKIVELPVQEQVRERALALHGKLADPAAHATWYRKLYLDETLPPKVRELAFASLARSMKDAELIKAFKDVKDGTLRRLALEELAKRGAAGVAELATDTLKQVNARPTDRAVAARVLAEKKGAKAAELLIEVGTAQATTDELLRSACAELAAKHGDEGTAKRLAAMVGKGKVHEQLFALHAAKGQLAADDKLRKKVRGEVDSKEPEVRRLAIRILGEVRDVEAIEPLAKLLAKPKDAGDVPAIVAALTVLHGPGDAAWRKQLLELAAGADRDRRNAALQSLSDPPKQDDLALFTQALASPDWSTRRIALQALEKLRDRDSVGAIVAQMQSETGRMQTEFAAALFRLTGEPHDSDAATWKRWWEGAGRSLPLITADELAKKEQERERRRLRQTTDTRFFGVKVASHRVSFVVDISGSMAELLRSATIDGRPAMRIDVVKQELVKTLQGLDAASTFNLITFNSSVQKWKEAAVPLNDKTRAEAVDYVQHLGSRGGTNIFDALEVAFSDPTVDTLFLLTDGEPSAGAITDLQLIRQHLADWNKTRGIVVHSVAVGGDFPLLEWLATDSGGTYTKFN